MENEEGSSMADGDQVPTTTNPAHMVDWKQMLIATVHQLPSTILVLIVMVGAFVYVLPQMLSSVEGMMRAETESCERRLATQMMQVDRLMDVTLNGLKEIEKQLIKLVELQRNMSEQMRENKDQFNGIPMRSSNPQFERGFDSGSGFESGVRVSEGVLSPLLGTGSDSQGSRQHRLSSGESGVGDKRRRLPGVRSGG